jgi:hypothetical membrane protein
MTDARRMRIATTAGLLGVAVMALGSVVTALAYSGKYGQPYSPLNHWVSELGETGVSELARVFNVSLMVGGLLFALFMALLAMSRSGPLRYAYGALGVIAGVAGFFVGVFPMNQLAQHSTAALTFFNLGWISVGLASLDFVLRPDPRFPRWLAIIGALTVVAFVGFLVAVQVDPLVGEDMLGAPENRPDFWIVATLEWAIIAGMLGWVAFTAWCWRRAGATTGAA